MKAIIDFAQEDMTLDRRAILSSQGIPPEAEMSKNSEQIYTMATELFRRLSESRGIVASITTSRFEEVFRGEGTNAEENPVEDIFRKSSYLALFCGTLGQVLSDWVTRLFESGDYALAYMLDSVSSHGADRLSYLAREYLRSELASEGSWDSSQMILCYSPGYCGWQLSGQKKLFEALHPQEIGITLNESYLMSPIKSVSGVLIAGPAEIHIFEPSYPFCVTCTTRSCIERMRK